ncbi:hypothetical protein Tco_0377150 [Tanacetum coccineum]
MMSDHNSSDLAPQRQEMSVENVSSGLVPQGQKASDYDNSDPAPPRQNVVPSAEKTVSSHQGLEFLFSPLLEEYYKSTHDQAEANNNDQTECIIQEAEFVNPFCTRVQEIVSIHLNQVVEIHPCQFKKERQLATDSEMWMASISSQLKSLGTSRQNIWQMIIKPNVVVDFEDSFAPVARFGKKFGFSVATQHTSLFLIYSDGRWENGILIGHEGGVYRCSTRGGYVDPDSSRKKLPSKGKLCMD